MNSAIRDYTVDTVDALAVYGSYKQSSTAGKFCMRAHFREALVSRQDSTGLGRADRGSALDPLIARHRRNSAAQITKRARTGVFDVPPDILKLLRDPA